MAKLIYLCIILFPFTIKAQIITTIAGGGAGGDGSIATSSYINDPTWLTFDKENNYYIIEGLGNDIRKITSLSNIITTFAGTGGSSYSGDGGFASSTSLGAIGSATFDSNCNYLYIADGGNYRILRVNMITNVVTTFAGNGLSGFGGDGGNATSAKLQPNDICFDKSGNTFICDVGNQRIRKISSTGIVSTYAGNGTPGFLGDNGIATDAEIDDPRGIATDDSGNLFIADLGNLRIRKVNIYGIITTVAGNGNVLYNGDDIPATSANMGPIRVTIHNRNLYLTDFNNNRIRMVDTNGIIHTICGNGISGFYGDGDPADSAELNGPSGITFDSCGNLYITQVNDGRIRKVSFNPSCAPEIVPQLPNNEIVIYPNPAQDELHIEGILNMEKYRLLNIKNNITQAGNLQMGSNTIDIRALPPGMYFLEMTDEKGYRTIKKVIKE